MKHNPIVWAAIIAGLFFLSACEQKPPKEKTMIIDTSKEKCQAGKCQAGKCQGAPKETKCQAGKCGEGKCGAQ